MVHEWNTAVHVADAEADVSKRAFTRKELIALFDHADEQVDRIRRTGRKGWLPAFRDSVLLKTAYAFGLRRNEIRMLDTVDFGRNPDGPEFGEYGVLYVPTRQGQEGLPAETAQRGGGLGLVEGDPPGMDRGVSAAVPDRRLAGVLAIRTRPPDRAQLDQHTAGHLPRRTRPGSGAGLPLAAQKPYHAPDRGWS